MAELEQMKGQDAHERSVVYSVAIFETTTLFTTGLLAGDEIIALKIYKAYI
jgi:hypothetical protein